MSLVEKAAPRRRVVVIVVSVAVALVAAVVIAFSVDTDSTPAERSSAPSTTGSSGTATVRGTAPMRAAPIDIKFDRDASYRVYLHRNATIGAFRVFAYIDLARRELRYVDEEQAGTGTVVGRVADRLVIHGRGLSLIDRDFAAAPIPIEGDDFIGPWRDHAIVAEFFPERTSFHEYRVDGSEARSVGLVGRPPDMIGGIVRDSVVVERAGHLLLLGLDDASVREFAVGNLLGVGGDRIFFASCTTQGMCTINEAGFDGVVRTTPIGGYIDPERGVVEARVAPDGSDIVVHDYRRSEDVVLARGEGVPLAESRALRDYVWAPTGGWLFRIDPQSKQLDAIDYRGGLIVTVPLPSDDSVALRSVAAW